MIVFDADGNFLDAWGEGVFTNAHGLYVGPDDRIYAADNFDQTVRIFTPDGELLQTLGEKDKPAETGFEAGKTPVQFGGGPFNRVTNVALSSVGELYVADGYGNARVHKFSAEGAHEFSWGEPGRGPGEFRLPHAIAVDRDDTVYVADRENSRIQVFRPDGEYVKEWNHVSRPDDLFIDGDDVLYVAELGEIAGRDPDVEILPHTPHARVTLLDLDGEVIPPLRRRRPRPARQLLRPARHLGRLERRLVRLRGGLQRWRQPRPRAARLPFAAEVRADPPLESRTVSRRFPYCSGWRSSLAPPRRPSSLRCRCIVRSRTTRMPSPRACCGTTAGSTRAPDDGGDPSSANWTPSRAASSVACPSRGCTSGKVWRGSATDSSC